MQCSSQHRWWRKEAGTAASKLAIGLLLLTCLGAAAAVGGTDGAAAVGDGGDRPTAPPPPQQQPQTMAPLPPSSPPAEPSQQQGSTSPALLPTAPPTAAAPQAVAPAPQPPQQHQEPPAGSSSPCPSIPSIEALPRAPPGMDCPLELLHSTLLPPSAPAAGLNSSGNGTGDSCTWFVIRNGLPGPLYSWNLVWEGSSLGGPLPPRSVWGADLTELGGTEGATPQTRITNSANNGSAALSGGGGSVNFTALFPSAGLPPPTLQQPNTTTNNSAMNDTESKKEARLSGVYLNGLYCSRPPQPADQSAAAPSPAGDTPPQAASSGVAVDGAAGRVVQYCCGMQPGPEGAGKVSAQSGARDRQYSDPPPFINAGKAAAIGAQVVIAMSLANKRLAAGASSGVDAPLAAAAGPPPSSPAASAPPPAQGPSGGGLLATVGITVSIVAGLALIAGGSYVFARRHRRLARSSTSRAGAPAVGTSGLVTSVRSVWQRLRFVKPAGPLLASRGGGNTPGLRGGRRLMLPPLFGGGRGMRLSLRLLSNAPPVHLEPGLIPPVAPIAQHTGILIAPVRSPGSTAGSSGSSRISISSSSSSGGWSAAVFAATSIARAKSLPPQPAGQAVGDLLLDSLLLRSTSSPATLQLAAAARYQMSAAAAAAAAAGAGNSPPASPSPLLASLAAAAALQTAANRNAPQALLGVAASVPAPPLLAPQTWSDPPAPVGDTPLGLPSSSSNSGTPQPAIAASISPPQPIRSASGGASTSGTVNNPARRVIAPAPFSGPSDRGSGSTASHDSWQHHLGCDRWGFPADEPGWLPIDFGSEVVLERKLGEGGFGCVWAARWKGELIAVKLVPVLSVAGAAAPPTPSPAGGGSTTPPGAATAGGDSGGAAAAAGSGGGAAAVGPDVAAISSHISASSVRAIRQEIRVLSRLQHPRIVRFLGACLAPPNICILEELALGGSLHARLYGPSRSSSGGAALAALAAAGSGTPALPHSRSNSGSGQPGSSSGGGNGSTPPTAGRRGRHGAPAPLPLREALVIASDVASAMVYLHAASGDKPVVVHRDLKPQNVLLHEGGRAKVCDFGISKSFSSTMASSTRLQPGTPAYMAPEQFEGRPVTDRVDVFAFGVLLWECLARRPPWKELSAMQIIFAVGIQGERLPRPPGCPDGLWRLIEACWREGPEQRPPFDAILPALLTELAAANKAAAAGTAAPAAAATAAEVAIASDSAGGESSAAGGSGGGSSSMPSSVRKVEEAGTAGVGLPPPLPPAAKAAAVVGKGSNPSAAADTSPETDVWASVVMF